MTKRDVNRSRIVIDSLRKHYGLSVGALADKLGVRASTVSSWVARDSINENLIYRKCDGVNFTFLSTGSGTVFNSTPLATIAMQDLDDIESAIIKEVRKKGRRFAAELLLELVKDSDKE